MAMRVVCHACSLVCDCDGVLSRSARCSRCGADLRCCRNCRFHDAGSYNDCDEPSAERVLEKDRANFCDYFAAAGSHESGCAMPVADGGGPGTLSELEKLFRKG